MSLDWMTNRMEIYLGLGSNLGDRKENISEALKRLTEAFGKNPKSVSDIIETRSWGFEGPDFANAVVCFDLDVQETEVERIGLEILDVCKRIEGEMGRGAHPQFDSSGERIYENRIIDIDILLMGECKIKNERLEVPHPLMRLRDFVMVPLRQINKNI